MVYMGHAVTVTPQAIMKCLYICCAIVESSSFTAAIDRSLACRT